MMEVGVLVLPCSKSWMVVVCRYRVNVTRAHVYRYSENKPITDGDVGGLEVRFA